MSTEIAKFENTGSRHSELTVTRYYGGSDVGVCVQIGGYMQEGGYGYVQLSAYDLVNLIPILEQEIIRYEKDRIGREYFHKIRQMKKF